MTGEIRIRRMGEADLSDVLRIERASFAVPWTPATFAGLLRRADAHLLVAEAEPLRGVLSLVGYAAVWVVVDQAELGDIAVDPEWRRRGIGQRLLDAVLALMRQQGVRELFLEVRASNVDAQRLYQRNGFTEVGRRQNYYSRPREDALVLRRQMEAGRAVGR
jgi:ribosomal-protein-alanine N-acetyltransferase